MIHAADLFCGAGGTSTGLALACRDLHHDVDLLAVNHWPTAVNTHQLNHPWARHLCETLDSVDPRKVVPGGRLQILAASPECTHHSNARGGKTMNDQSRATAWHVLRWAEGIRVDSILIENVREFTSWGPLGNNGRPLKHRKGETFNAWLAALKSLGYQAEWKLVNAADYGDPTTRLRFFLMAKRGKGVVRWPVTSHSKDPVDLFDAKTKWRAAREIIDWQLPSKSIFTRKKPLADKTLARIAEGLRRFGGRAAEPFLLLLRGGGCQGAGGVRNTNDPLATVSAGGSHHALCQPQILPPFLIPQFGERAGQDPRTHNIEEPLPAVTSHGAGALIEALATPHQTPPPFLRGQQSGAVPRSTDQPTPTVATKGAIALIEPLLLPYYGATVGLRSCRDPLDTVTTKERFALIQTANSPMRLDIRLRMLQPHELAAAMGFPKDYKFAGNRTEQVKQIGNAVAVNTAKALCKSLLS